MKTILSRYLRIWNTYPNQETDNCIRNASKNDKFLLYLFLLKLFKFYELWILNGKFKASCIKHHSEVNCNVKAWGFILVLLKLDGAASEPFLFSTLITMLLIKGSSELKLNSKLYSHHLSWKAYDTGVAVIWDVWERKPLTSFFTFGVNIPYRGRSKPLKMAPKVISRTCISIGMLWKLSLSSSLIVEITLLGWIN